jgi:hypothetical protein
MLKKGSAYDCSLFVRDVPGADVKRFQKVVMEKGDAWVCEVFARCVKGADVELLRAAILQKKTRGDEK